MDLIEIKIGKFVGNRHPWELSRFEVCLKLINPYIDLNREHTIVDIGCGDAFFIGQLSLKYPNLKCFGIDINFTNNQILEFKKYYPNAQFYKSCFNLIENVSKIDLILLMDVIEHIENVSIFIETELNPIISKYNPYLFITVPAFQSLFSSHDVLLSHFRRYNVNTLSTQFESHDIKVLKSGYFFFSLFLIRIFDKTKEKLFRSSIKEGVTNWKHQKWMTSLIKNILIFDFILLYWLKPIVKIPGLSVYAICKRIV